MDGNDCYLAVGTHFQAFADGIGKNNEHIMLLQFVFCQVQSGPHSSSFAEQGHGKCDFAWIGGCDETGYRLGIGRHVEIVGKHEFVFDGQCAVCNRQCHQVEVVQRGVFFHDKCG